MNYRRSLPAWLAVFLSAALLHAAKAPATRPAARSNDPTVPAQKDPKRHEAFLADLKAMEGKVGLLFVGDSITDWWRGRGKAVFEKEYGQYRPLNLGISGDRTQHVLWRLENGEVEGITPKVAVLMIGTNNLGGNTNAEIVAGVTKVVQTLREKLPKTKVLLLGIFPRANADHPYRARIKAINEELAKLDEGKSVKYLDIGPAFVDKDGQIPKDVMPDGLHPNEKGYNIWADAMRETLEKMMK